jgi:hypothetical protein
MMTGTGGLWHAQQGKWVQAHTPVAPGLVFRVQAGVVSVAQRAPEAVEVACVALKQVRGRQVAAAAEPGLPRDLRSARQLASPLAQESRPCSCRSALLHEVVLRASKCFEARGSGEGRFGASAQLACLEVRSAGGILPSQQHCKGPEARRCAPGTAAHRRAGWARAGVQGGTPASMASRGVV